VLADLVALVSERATTAGSTTDESLDGLESLRVAVEALDTYLDILQVLRNADPKARTPPQPRPESRDIGGDVPAPAAWSEGPAGGTPAPIESRPSPARFPPFRDQATGLLSRDGFNAGVNAEVRRSGRYSRSMTVLVLRLGGADGEEVNRAGVALRRGLRASDLVGRDGDRSLLVALPETDEVEAAGVAARAIRLLTLADGWDTDSAVGLSAYPVDGETPAALLDRARRRLDQFAEPGPRAEPTPELS
jgi:GGDEF domain-containing protein